MVPSDPHANGQILTRGPAPETARVVLIMIHGRGASAESILSLYDAMDVPDVAALAPQASGGTWYPQSFLAPIEANQPYLDSALGRIDAVVEDLLARGIASRSIAFLGFSQGACLTSEYLVRHPRRYHAAMILTGGVIGPPGMKRQDEGSLDGTPIFISTGVPDAHVPESRVMETESILMRMGAEVDARRYPGRPHSISQDEFDACHRLLQAKKPT